MFLANYRATPHPSAGKSPYELCMNRTVRTKLPTVRQVSPDAKVVQKDKEAKARMKAYGDLKRQTKPLRLNIGDHVLVKQRTQNKASPRFELVPYTIQDIKDSMITAKRATDQKLVTPNCSFFKKLANPPEEVIQGSSPVPQIEPQALFDFDDPETSEPTEMSATQEEFNRATPSEIVPKTKPRLLQWINQSHHRLSAYLAVGGKLGNRNGPRTMLRTFARTIELQRSRCLSNQNFQLWIELNTWTVNTSFVLFVCSFSFFL